mmetsp:Transcript_31515/g.45917  ORF Transcript_31515/g.45917 Transcript_31515/m.45917 type:complete len:98 (+) Transcript_31515:828-1121(+)
MRPKHEARNHDQRHRFNLPAKSTLKPNIPCAETPPSSLLAGAKEGQKEQQPEKQNSDAGVGRRCQCNSTNPIWALRDYASGKENTRDLVIGTSTPRE